MSSDYKPSRKVCGRKTQLFILMTLDLASVAMIWYACSRVQYATFHYSIGKATLTLTSTYKIVGISGGPIAGKINSYRQKLLLAHEVGMGLYAFATCFYTIVQVVEHVRLKRMAKPPKGSSYCDYFSKLVYFLCFCVAFGMALIGVVIWYCSWKGLDISGASFDVKDGAKIVAGAAILMAFVQCWRGLTKAVRPPKGYMTKEQQERIEEKRRQDMLGEYPPGYD